MQRGVRDEIRYGSELAVVVMRVHLGEQRLAQRNEFLGRILVEESEQSECCGEIMDDGPAAKECRALHGDRDAASDSIVVVHVAEMETIVEQLHQRQGVALVGALGAETGARWLGSTDVTRTVSNPRFTAAGRRGVPPNFFSRVRWHIVRSSHVRRLASLE